jgi:hypothetical protein
MADDHKSFNELLSEAPLASDTVTVIGALSRTHELDKFMITLADGRSLTLPTNSVRSFSRLAGAIGQVVVQLELDAKLVPHDVARLEDHPGTIAAADPQTILAADLPTVASLDQPATSPLHDLPVTIAELTGTGDPKLPSVDGTGVRDILNTGVADIGGVGTAAEQIGPIGPGPVFGGVAPFALATPHQAPAETLAALTQLQGVAPLGLTFFWLDRQTVASQDKPPLADGTTVHHPYSDT